MNPSDFATAVPPVPDPEPLSGEAPPAIATTPLFKHFGPRRVIDGLRLVVPAGSFYALLGPNGAGKTTTLRLLVGLSRPDGGRIAVFGHDTLEAPEAARRHLAFLPDEPLVYGHLTVAEYLEFVAGLWSLPLKAAEDRARGLLVEFDLVPAVHRRLDACSRGMQQKVCLIGAMIRAPKLLVMDEPLTGLDVGAGRQVRDYLARFTREGGTVLFTTHILEVAERLATRIGIVQAGRLVEEGSLAELRARHATAGATLEDVFLRATEAPVSAAPRRDALPGRDAGTDPDGRAGG